MPKRKKKNKKNISFFIKTLVQKAKSEDYENIRTYRAVLRALNIYGNARTLADIDFQVLRTDDLNELLNTVMDYAPMEACDESNADNKLHQQELINLLEQNMIALPNKQKKVAYF